MPNDNVEYVTDEDETTYNGNCYSKKISGYFYNKLSNIANNNEFSQAQLEEFGLSETNGKIDISTTKKLINYLKSYVKLYIDEVNGDTVSISDYTDYTNQTNATLTELTSDFENITDIIYPVGSIYMSTNDVDPTNLFGGVWVKLENRFLLGSGTRDIGTKGGVEQYTLQKSEMPKHTHVQNSHTHKQDAHTHKQNAHYHPSSKYKFLMSNDINRTAKRAYTSTNNNGIQYAHMEGEYTLVSNTGNATATNQNATATNQSATATNQEEGGGRPHENMPPFLVVHMWRREKLKSEVS